ncbi:MAG: hypothetical protein KA791_10025 [Flavobacteriales bacterium]|nr:hypothetical protein [Flavobacteriales bacterium]
MDIASAREIVLSEFHAEESDHFGTVAFRIKARKAGGKPGRTFMTLWLEEGFAVLMLDTDLQAGLLDHRSRAFERHPSKWGDKGATILHLVQVDHQQFREAVGVAFTHAQR